jgi:hypothetical protein
VLWDAHLSVACSTHMHAVFVGSRLVDYVVHSPRLLRGSFAVQPCANSIDCTAQAPMFGLHHPALLGVYHRATQGGPLVDTQAYGRVGGDRPRRARFEQAPVTGRVEAVSALHGDAGWFRL